MNWNGISDTIECIESVLNLVENSYHVHLIDNGSQNNEGVKLKELYSNHHNITVHCYEKNLHFTGAHLKIWNDILITDSDIRYVALLNNDTIVDPRWLSELSKLGEEQTCGIVASKMIQYYNREQMDNAGHKILNTGEILPIGHGDKIENYNQRFKNIGGCGGAVLYDASMLRRIGFFDDHFTTGYEDAELGLRAVVSGYESWYCPDAIVYHKGGQSIKKIFNESYSIMIFSSILYSYFKNLKQSDLLINISSVLIRFLIITFIDLILFRWKYLRVMYHSIWNTIRQSSLIIKKRAQSNHRKHSIIKYMSFFLFTDFKRFKTLLISDYKAGSIDHYGSTQK